MTPNRSASAPNFAIRSRGSGELPSDLDILRPCLSRMISGEVDVFERQFTDVFEARHDHSSDPEEDNIRAGDEIGCGIKRFERFGGIGPSPMVANGQSQEENHVSENVIVLRPKGLVCRSLKSAVRDGAIFQNAECFGWDFESNRSTGCGFVGTVEVPYGKSVSPPKLAGDTPILNSFEPVIVNFRPAFRVKAPFAGAAATSA